MAIVLASIGLMLLSLGCISHFGQSVVLVVISMPIQPTVVSVGQFGAPARVYALGSPWRDEYMPSLGLMSVMRTLSCTTGRRKSSIKY